MYVETEDNNNAVSGEEGRDGGPVPEAEPLPEAETLPEEGAPPLGDDLKPLQTKKPGKLKTSQVLQLMFDPEHFENEKSLWKFFLEDCKAVRKIDEFVSKLERGDPAAVRDMDKVYIAWFDELMAVYRSYVQRVFEEPISLGVAGKRMASYVCAQKHLKDGWRYEWIKKYRNLTEESAAASSSLGATVANTEFEEKRKQALDKRQRVLQAARERRDSSVRAEGSSGGK